MNFSYPDSFDLTESVFHYKNKEYGAYILRTTYRYHLTLAMLIVITFFVIITSAPLLYSKIFNQNSSDRKIIKTVQISQLTEPPSIVADMSNKQFIPASQQRATVKFVVPEVKPDQEVKDESVPSIDELKTADPGTETQEGVQGGYDPDIEYYEEDDYAEEEELPYLIAVDFMPEPIDGLSGIQKRLNYPEAARNAGIEGTVLVKAFVDEKGIVNRAEITKGIGYGCDEAALEVVRATRFTPGRQNGSYVRVQTSISVKFRL